MTNKQQRKKAREAVLQALYAIHLSQEDEEKVLIDINERYNFDSATKEFIDELFRNCLLYTSPSPRDATLSRMPSSA